jgi:hypothetical protein
LLLVVLVAVVAAPVASSVGGGGLHGTVRRGPIWPVCPTSGPCDAPVRVTLVFARAATPQRRYRIRSHADGAYRIALPAGVYTVTTKERVGIRHNIRPHRVRVRAGRWNKVDFSIDTGIR